MARDDLLDLLDEQRSFLEASAAAVDCGNGAEAKRLASSLRLLLHDAGQSLSLLTQLDVRNTLPWLDSAILPEKDLEHDFALGLCRLVQRGIGDSLKAEYGAPLSDLGPDRTHPPAAFVDWWNETVLIDTQGRTFSRRRYVLDVANKDGGAHVDPELRPAYRALTRDNSMQHFAGPGMLAFGFAPSLSGARGLPAPPSGSIALASVRQITHEVLETLSEHLGPNGTVTDPICPLPVDTPINVGRDDPCPCGGPRKLRDCFGLRRPRDPRATRSAAIVLR